MYLLHLYMCFALLVLILIRQFFSGYTICSLYGAFGSISIVNMEGKHEYCWMT